MQPRLLIALAGIGLAGSFRGLLQLPDLFTGAEVARPAAVAAQGAMALLCLAFLLSFAASLWKRRTLEPRQ